MLLSENSWAESKNGKYEKKTRKLGDMQLLYSWNCSKTLKNWNFFLSSFLALSLDNNIYAWCSAFILCPVLGSWFVHNRCRHRFYHISFFQFNSISHIHINVNMNTRFSLMQLNIMLFLYEMNVYNTDKYFYSKRMMQLAAFHFHGWNEIV